MADEADLKLDISVPFTTESEAQIACNSLSVDPEPKRGGAKKRLTVKGNVLHATIQSSEAKTLRVCANAFLDHLTLVTETIEAFGPPLEQ
ncbi:EKC/KEOPS complex subunit Lage3-like [Oculina patagonica]